MFRCISDSKLPIMLHTVFPEPHTGFSGFYHFKMWLHFVKLAHSADLTLCGFSTDSCSTGIAAARLLMTPSAACIQEFGVTYLGLPHCSYKYYSVFLRPAVGRYIPPPFDWYGEIAHHIRNFRKNIGNLKKVLVFYSEQDTSTEGTVEAGLWASMRFLKELAESRADISRQFGLSEMVNINSWFDQRNDAAERYATPYHQ